MATRKLVVYPNKDLMIQAGAQRFVLVLLELIAMYLQARNASETEMDKRLGVASHRNKDDVAK